MVNGMSYTLMLDTGQLCQLYQVDLRGNILATKFRLLWQKGYSVDENGVLIHTKSEDPCREFIRIVVPSPRKNDILDVAHRGLASEHFRHSRMVGSLKQHFTWPGMRRDIRQYCSSCPECQRAGKHLQSKVLMVETPIISVPYHRLACDLVGPLPRTKSGILTVMCLGTRYPYCIPLKKVDAITVAEGLLEVIAHTGIPYEILSDQGSVFTGKVMKELCKSLDIQKLRTTAYHPQTNGALERWHGCLKGMLRRIQTPQQDWDTLLKYCLLAYRVTPRTATGFSPYELVHGRALRGPLEAMKDGWIKGELSFASTTQWVGELRETLTKLHEATRSNEMKYKASAKEAYNKGTKNREFRPGDCGGLAYTLSYIR